MLDEYQLQRELDKVKAEVFTDDNAAFLGSIMCSLKFAWDDTISTAATNGEMFWWNPTWFLSLPFKTRCTVLLHELWHVARLHMLRGEGRCPDTWNAACDYRINNDLDNEVTKTGQKLRSFDGTKPLLNHGYDANGIVPEEDLYEILVKQGPKPMQGTWGVPGEKGDLRVDGTTPVNPANIIATVVRAVQQSEMSQQAGNLPGDIKKTLDKFLAPQIPWRSVLNQFLTNLGEDDFTWKRPNRRYTEMYMPSREPDEGRLTDLAYIVDRSGSITEKQNIIFNSEIKYIKEVLKPDKLTIVQFDTCITDVREFGPDDPFEFVEIVGGGGTWLEPVREWLEENKPTAAVIFSDLYCAPMNPLSWNLPIFWAVVNNKEAEVPFGKMVHITDEG